MDDASVGRQGVMAPAGWDNLPADSLGKDGNVPYWANANLNAPLWGTHIMGRALWVGAIHALREETNCLAEIKRFSYFL